MTHVDMRRLPAAAQEERRRQVIIRESRRKVVLNLDRLKVHRARLIYVEILPDKKNIRAAGFLVLVLHR